MIKKVYSNHPSFKPLEFRVGFNVVLADRTDHSTQRDSRNGLGKSTLIDIIHFCLGAKSSAGKGLLVDALRGWEFTLEIEIDGADLTVTRRVDKPSAVFVTGDTSRLALQPTLRKGERSYGLKQWTAVLGSLAYGLPPESPQKYQPSFRSLISYSIRQGKDAFSTPFEHHRKQPEWSKQVNNAFLLGLAWSDATDLQLLKDRRKGLDALKRAAKTGVVKGFAGSIAELEARRVTLQTKADREAESLASFRVHPQYDAIRIQADRLTEEIHEAANQNFSDQRMLSLYQKALSEEAAPVSEAIDKIYADAGVALPGLTMRNIDAVRAFHHSIVHNRKDFLSAEVDRLHRAMAERAEIIKEKTASRADALTVLQTHGALEEFTLIQRRHLDLMGDLKSIEASIENLTSCETGLSQLKIDQEVLQQKARRDYQERRGIWEKAIELFNGYTDRLYNAPGRLLIEFGSNGFQFDVEIERSGSTGVENMKIFCYDMTLASLWTEKSPSPRLVIHDSVIYDGVDERQRALALELAAHEAAAKNFQYICTLNSDEVPSASFSRGFKLDDYVRATLTDDDITGSLLGIRF